MEEITTIDLDEIQSLREDSKLEAKAALNDLPHSFWETYSSFANTNGGLVLLGVRESSSHELSVTGVINPDKLIKQLWDGLNNRNLVSANILTESDIVIESEGDLKVISIRIPQANRETCPLYIRGDLFRGTYRRNGEGDYRCSQDEVKAMLRDSATGTPDRTTLPHIPLDALSTETIDAYRTELHLAHPQHPWARLSNKELLMRLGAAEYSKEDGELHPTRAGLLMFGEEWRITSEFPYYFLEYREVLSKRRWDDRIVTSDGEWSGNILDFWLRVAPRLTSELKRPFTLDKNLRREDDTPLHKALREALANALVHADYYGTSNTTIIRYDDSVAFTNAGTLLLPAEVVIAGGLSETRNPTIAKMFNLLGIGEKAGSGFDAMRAGCDFAKVPYPELSESFAPDITQLVFHLAPSTPTAATANVHTVAGVKRSSPEEQVTSLAKERGTIYRRDVESLLGTSKASASNLLARLVRDGSLKRIGNGRSTAYRLA